MANQQTFPSTDDPISLTDKQKLLVDAISKIRDYGIFLLDAEGRVLTWNAGAERIKGYAPSEIIGRHFSVFYTPEDKRTNHPQNELDTARKVGNFEEEGWRVRKDGSRFWANILITAMMDDRGNLIGYSKVTKDLSERKKTEETLKASEERFRQLVEGVKDYAIFLLDANGNIATWNVGAERFKGYRANEIIGQHFSKFYPPEDIEAGKCEYELEEAALTGRFEDEGWRVRKDGTRFWANVVITAIRDHHGRVTGYSKVTRDLTERKRAEERLRRSNEDLERRVEKRTEELERAKEDMERAIVSRDEFLSIASHELKTPITSLSLQAQMLRARTSSKTGKVPPVDRLESSLDTIIRQSGKLSALIEDLLDVSRVQIGKFSFNFVQSNLSELSESIARNWIDPLESANCRFETQIEPDLHAVLDSYRIEQVFANLLSNTIKYAPGTPVLLSVRKDGRFAVIKVKDEGRGIELSQQSRIFDRYERLEGNSGIAGLGLGLFISKAIVEAHHGTISVESKVGEGSTFVVRLPILG